MMDNKAETIVLKKNTFLIYKDYNIFIYSVIKL